MEIGEDQDMFMDKKLRYHNRLLMKIGQNKRKKLKSYKYYRKTLNLKKSGITAANN